MNTINSAQTEIYLMMTAEGHEFKNSTEITEFAQRVKDKEKEYCRKDEIPEN